MRGRVGDEGPAPEEARVPEAVDDDAFERDVDDRVRGDDGGRVAAVFLSERDVEVRKTGNVSGTTMCTAEGVMKDVEVDASVEEDECGCTMTVTFSSKPMSTMPVRPVSPIVHRLDPLTLGSTKSTLASQSLDSGESNTVVSASSTFVVTTWMIGGGVDARRVILPPTPTEEEDDDADGDREHNLGGSADIGDGSLDLRDGRLAVVLFGEKNDVRRDVALLLPEVGESMSGAFVEKDASDADESMTPIS